MHPIALGNRNGSLLSPPPPSFFFSPSSTIHTGVVCRACFTVVDECLVGNLSRDILLVNVPLLVYPLLFPPLLPRKNRVS